MNRGTALSIAVVLSFGCATQQLAKSVANAALSGVVLDENDLPIEGAEVIAVTPDQRRLTASTGADGRFAFFKLEPGYYDVLAQKTGYIKYGSTNQLVRDGHDLKLQLALKQAKTPANTTAPQFIAGPSPQYTQEAWDHKVKGTAIAKCIITAEGRVEHCLMIRSVQYMDAAVIAALQARRYQPATVDGKPVDVTYTFKLNLAPAAD